MFQHPPHKIPSKQWPSCKHQARASSRKNHIINSKPWSPFRSRTDFEFAEIALEAALNKDQITRLINLIQWCGKKPDSFTLKSHTELCEAWKAAAHDLTPFSKVTISVPFRNEEHQFDVHFRPLWDWALDLLNDPELAPHFVFNAERLSKYNGRSFVQFFDEPWTAKDFWDIQLKLPEGAKPFCFILYADKTKLSSFGSTKGYPVVARCANLPVDIRNSRGVGGGRVVGWLPVVPEDEAHKGKTTFANFKNIVWHEAFLKILESIEPLSKTGYWHEDIIDHIQRHLFPIMLILSADYEEQCAMASTRGGKSKFPCPVCLVPKTKLSDHSQKYDIRTSVKSEATVRNANFQPTEAEKEEILKSQGLRPVNNVFWKLGYSDVHRALSWDRLHAHHTGLWGHHLWKELIFWIYQLGRPAAIQLDDQFKKMPRWRNLNHFDNVVSLEFADATKHEDISKVWHYFPIFMDALKIFSQTMDEYIKAIEGTREKDKDWNFPKKHTNIHVFDDIEAKGVTRNYNTKPNEQLHGPLKDSYQLRTNFKDVAEQILRADHWCYVSKYIRQNITAFDDSLRPDPTIQDFNDVDDITNASGPVNDGTGHVSLGSIRPSVTFQALEQLQKDDVAFNGFRIKLANFLNNFLPSINVPLPGGRHIKLSTADKITEYRFLKVNYESFVDWRQYTDYLRCSPKFYNHPRYDCVLLQTTNGAIFARLVFVFTCSIDNATYLLALVQPYDAPTGQRRCKDKDLQLWRLHSKLRSATEIVPVQSIIRGAALAQDYDNPGDFFVIDTIDTDWFLRIKKIWNGSLHS
ncbi:hypothetical protein SERLADRAFT_373989 [Serpula lacrymans var. lacrymans S7.9]|uniref:Uncharacterized protein n=1 Tax=Serpula lacrymans var. lacrymans (strain S7.9) TaxID=578457 RepID=F8PAU1_SERL9|nr:uncharacterized protein SERLADRAFT_373989 [Serpula lacrymans var. lacrymans S7.9]EGO19929.1 hypothetical protein SERLADRAFT_373989 [Serpula lacrymans var. lacrymans S7.9]